MKNISIILMGLCVLGLVACQNNTDKKASSPQGSSALSDISENSEPLDKQDCEDKFKNKNGICEVPNHPHPKTENDKKP